VAPVVGVHELQRSYSRPVELDGIQQVRRGLHDLHDLDQRAADQRYPLSGPWRVGM
jgi:hypothetical protein